MGPEPVREEKFRVELGRFAAMVDDGCDERPLSGESVDHTENRANDLGGWRWAFPVTGGRSGNSLVARIPSP